MFSVPSLSRLLAPLLTNAFHISHYALYLFFCFCICLLSDKGNALAKIIYNGSTVEHSINGHGLWLSAKEARSIQLVNATRGF